MYLAGVAPLRVVDHIFDDDYDDNINNNNHNEPKRNDNGEWRSLHNEELHSLYPSPNIIRVIKSRRLRWASHVARMEVGSY